MNDGIYLPDWRGSVRWKHARRRERAALAARLDRMTAVARGRPLSQCGEAWEAATDSYFEPRLDAQPSLFEASVSRILDGISAIGSEKPEFGAAGGRL